MNITLVEINNFRNLSRVTLQPSPGVNYLIGKNAQGKTSFLEALFVLTNGVSFRPVRDRELAQNGCDSYMLKASYRSPNRTADTCLEFSTDKGKILRVNGKRTRFNYPDGLKVLLFTPDELYLVKGTPETRRSFLDFILCQLSPDYRHDVNRYHKILKRRNYLLKTAQSDAKAFSLLDDMFVQIASRIILARIKLTVKLEEEMLRLHQLLSAEDIDLRFKYAISFAPLANEPVSNGIPECLRQALFLNRQKELDYRTTLVGPHREDFNLYLQGKNARKYASQGQQRTLAIALKLAAMLTIKDIKGFFPVFLLDDVLAELDSTRRLLLLQYLRASSFQTFLSSVDQIDAEGSDKIFSVTGGKIIEEV